MIIKCETVRIIHTNENFQLIAAIPMGDMKGLDINPRYRTISIKDEGHRLVLDKKYTLDVEAMPKTKYGTTYLLRDIPTLSFNSPSDITDEMEKELLLEITTKRQANYVHKAYPNFVRLVLSNQVDKIDVSKIHNVSTKRLNIYINKIMSRYSTFLLRRKVPEYRLNMAECDILFNVYRDINNCIENLKTKPYYCLITLCGRSFRQTDGILLEANADLKYSEERIEYMLDYAIGQFELEGSTYVDAERLGEYIYTLDVDVIPYIRDIAIKSDLIHYEEDSNVIQRELTYKQELGCANFLKNTLQCSTELDWDWTKYTKIKDGTLTDEQRNILNTFCKYNVMILDAPSGTGKTSSLMALIQMIEDNDMSYSMMSPTGKAASRLAEQTGRKASTIHRAILDVENLTENSHVIIIDEASMLSVPLFKMLIDTLDSASNKYDHRIVFVGDSAQIPSIGLGRVFKDMGESGMIPKCTLTKCFRFDEGGASYISTLTRQGKFYLTEEQLKHDRVVLGAKQDYEFIKFNGTVEQITDTYMSLIKQGIKPQDIVILVPYNIGNYGAIKLNNLIQSATNPVHTSDITMKTKHNDIQVIIHENDLVMNTKNNYNAISATHYDDMVWDDDAIMEDVEATSVFNGQVGYVVEAKKDTELINDNILIVNIEGENIIYTQKDINNLLLAYATNPYKFQGSQCKYVINVVIGAHARSWNRQLLYTAQTRMTTKLIEIGDPQVIMEAVSKAGDDNRKTRLGEFLVDNTTEM